MKPALKTRIPPPVYAVATGVTIWLSVHYWPSLRILGPPLTWLGWPAIALGISLDAGAAAAFLRNRTTINPLQPLRATVIVTEGIYRLSRNPMYLGLVGVLSGWTWVLGAPACLLFVGVFSWVILQVQIKPEEAALTAKFGDAYLQYTKKVHRWIGWSSP